MDAQRSALMIVDMLNPYEHEDADDLTPSVERAVGNIRDLISRAREEGVKIIYVNDNYGHWTSLREELVEAACQGARPDLVELIVPEEGTAFVIKARHSIFYGTPLEYLLGQEGIDHLVLAGQVTEQCILYSALDAYVRHHHVTVPRRRRRPHRRASGRCRAGHDGAQHGGRDLARGARWFPGRSARVDREDRTIWPTSR